MKMTSNSFTASSKPECDGEQHDRSEVWKRHIEKGLDRADAVEFRRLVDMRRDGRQPRQQDDEHERRPLPDVGQHDREIDPGNFADPADFDLAPKQLAQQVVGGTEGPLQEKRPRLADDDRADEKGNDEDRHDDPSPPERLHHRQGERQTKNELDGYDRDRQRDGHAERRPGQRIVDDLLEILQPDEGVARNLEVVIDEGDPQREQERVDRKRQDDENCWRDHQPFEMAIAPGCSASSPNRGS